MSIRWSRSIQLRLSVCPRCLLVQLEEFESPERIFGDYPYFSSHSDTWLDHASKYCDDVVKRSELGLRTQVVEIVSNDGYLLQHFHTKGVPCLGVEPPANVARAAVDKGIPTLVKFFGEATAATDDFH